MLSPQDGVELSDAISRKCPAKIDIGPVYTHKPQDRKKYEGERLAPRPRALWLLCLASLAGRPGSALAAGCRTACTVCLAAQQRAARCGTEPHATAAGTPEPKASAGCASASRVYAEDMVLLWPTVCDLMKRAVAPLTVAARRGACLLACRHGRVCAGGARAGVRH